MQREIKIRYYWKCDKLGYVPKEFEESLAELAENRIAEMMQEGYTSGSLSDNTYVKIEGKRTPKDGWECLGAWEAQKDFI